MTGTATRTELPTGTWKADPVHSSVGFEVKHMVVSTFRGGFADFDIALSDEEGEPTLEGAVRVDSVEVRDETLNGHLQSPDFFDAERHPEIRFSSTGIRAEGDGLVVDGALAIKGTTRAVEARGELTGPVTDPQQGERIGLELETTVDRTEFGLEWNAPLPRGGFAVENEVTLVVHLELVEEV